MPRAEPGSAKYIANKIKAKGLQRLKFYCQLCEKQCRDDNGWKCHLASPSHQRNAKAQEDTGDAQIMRFSRQFQQQFVYLLKASHGTKPINANKFYGEYIMDRDHVHMNATRWQSLGGFLRSLEKKKIVTLSEDDYGLLVAYNGTSKTDLEADNYEPDRLDTLEQQIKRQREQMDGQGKTSDQQTHSNQATQQVDKSPTDLGTPHPQQSIEFSIPKKRRTHRKMTPL